MGYCTCHYLSQVMRNGVTVTWLNQFHPPGFQDLVVVVVVLVMMLLPAFSRILSKAFSTMLSQMSSMMF